ncbi:HAD family hydrolase [Micromonospora sp. NPDC001898]|uniref:HAD family hydrolase n=1 Tax=Micromonospora sp. NPDC001898 TaxID=3364221 RepID=UPI003681D91A
MIAARLPRPRALLLDFGGVVVQTARRDTWVTDLATEVVAMLGAAGCTELTIDDVVRDVRAAAAADSAWKNAMSRLSAPAELTWRVFWSEFVAADWPDQARALVTSQAWFLCRRQGELRSTRVARNGIEDLLRGARERDIPVAIVSNAMSGIVHRDWLAQAGLDKDLALQLYSDELGIRKPNPEMIRLACRALAVAPSDAWYVGDNFDRDVVCGRRAGVGVTVLMTARSTHDLPFVVAQTPDAVVDDPAELLRLLTLTDERHA